MIIISLIQNIAFLIALAAVYQIIRSRLRYSSIVYQVINGFLFGGMGILFMTTPLNLLPGILFDGRAILLGVAGLYGGALVAGISVVICAVYRLWLGGDGAMVGVGLIVTSALTGFLFASLRTRIKRIPEFVSLWLFGLVVHIEMLLWIMVLPTELSQIVMRQIALPVLLLYPPATVLICLLFNDYEAQLKAQENLRISENRFRMLAENARDMIFRFEFSPIREFKYISSAVQRISGYSPEELYGEVSGWDKMVHPDDRQIVQSVSEGNVNFDEPIFLRWIGKDGRMIWIEQRNTPIYDRKGKLIALEGIARDISSQKEAESLLRESEEKYRLIAENARDVILVMEHDTSFRYVSPSVIHLLGYTPDEVQRLTFLDLLSPLSQQSFLQTRQVYEQSVYKQVDPDIPGQIMKFELIRKDGSRIWSEVVLSTIQNEQVSEVNLLAVVRDISVRQQTENKLHDLHKLMRYILEHDRVGVAVLDQALTFIYVSQQYLIDNHIQGERATGKKFVEIIATNQGKWLGIFEETLQGRILNGEDDPIEHTDGTIDWLRWESRPWYVAGDEIGGIILYCETITEQKMAEDALMNNRDLLAKLTDQVPGMVYQFRVYPDGSSSISYASSGAVDLYELTPEEILEDAAKLFNRIHPGDLERIMQEIDTSARTLNFYHSEFRVILPRKGLGWRLCDAKPEKLADNSVQWHGIVTDITERKRSEQKINEQMAELRRWNQAMIGREKRALELKQEINHLLLETGRPQRYAFSGEESQASLKQNGSIKDTESSIVENYEDLQ